jgi:hypothetical protein
VNHDDQTSRDRAWYASKAAAVRHPAAAAQSCEQICLAGFGTEYCVGGGSPAVLTGTGGNLYTAGSCTPYQGKNYCQVKVGGDCPSWDDVTGNPVNLVSCNGEDRQDWWWSGARFRNLYATKANEDACMNAKLPQGGQATVDVYVCSYGSSDWMSAITKLSSEARAAIT